MRRELTAGEAQACFAVCEKRYGEAMLVTAYEVVRGLNRYYEDKSSLACGAPSDIYFFEAKTRREIHIQASDENIDRCIKWLREKHGIFYYEAMNPAIALEEDVSMRIANFWRLVDEENKQIEEYCKNDPACGLSLKKLHKQYLAYHVPPITYSFPLDTDTLSKPSAEKFIEDLWRLISDEPVPEIKNTSDQIDFYNKVRRTVVKYKNELLNLRKDNGTLNAELSELRSDHDTLTESYARLWEDKERKKRMLNSYYGATCGATTDVYGEIQRLKKERDELKEKCDNLVKLLEEIDEYGYGGHVCSGCRLDELNERIHNQEQIIKAQNKSLTQQSKQLKDLGASLRDIKEVVDCEMDDLMQMHGDDIIPMF